MTGNPGNIVKTSEFDTQYNCIAWAAGDTDNWWWPKVNPNRKSYWPEGAPNEETLDAFIKAFERLGYMECVDSLLENGYGKIAIYCDRDQTPTHASRQLPDGQWTSKLGRHVDVSHDFEGLSMVPFFAHEYGNIVVLMKKQI